MSQILKKSKKVDKGKLFWLNPSIDDQDASCLSKLKVKIAEANPPVAYSNNLTQSVEAPLCTLKPLGAMSIQVTDYTYTCYTCVPSYSYADPPQASEKSI